MASISQEVNEDSVSDSEHDGISQVLAEALQQMDEIIAVENPSLTVSTISSIIIDTFAARAKHHPPITTFVREGERRLHSSQLDLRMDDSIESADHQNEPKNDNMEPLICSSPPLIANHEHSVQDQPIIDTDKPPADDFVNDGFAPDDWISKVCKAPQSLALTVQLGGVIRIRVANLVAELSHVIRKTDDADGLKNAVSYDSLRTLRDWLLPDVDELFDIFKPHVYPLIPYPLRRSPKKLRVRLETCRDPSVEGLSPTTNPWPEGGPESLRSS
ncbi:hypothetical protein PoB_005691100 [Plakobranchus ocellatus]|uniref:Uncharacterized protein n=1 Tax=Plakobranchus ocellatus TaxID=259542 RepID=A0AAV4CGA2_9GAST|nr:hypothetical protein PoB_005691100 [Plakobranchus ocellatus]